MPFISNGVEEVAESASIAYFIGPIFIGNILNWMLMGTLVVQAYSYYQRFAKDRIIIRALVAVLFVLDIIQTVILTDCAWFFMVREWGQAKNLGTLPWSAVMIPCLSGVVAAMVQTFYAWRIWILSRTRVTKALAIIIILIAIAQCLAGIITSGELFRNSDQENLGRLHPGFSFWSAGSSAADILITGCMTYLLYTAKRQTSWGASETMLTRLINNTIQTGLLTVVCACIQTFLFEDYTSRGKNTCLHSRKTILKQLDVNPQSSETKIGNHATRLESAS
ncbi:hypothetical protein Moror_4604 [Moniliophthora roreri MCA 2997]|uniref:DUF6534 domain-containing protein n=2 Tax=Moniliophthora roreri TaxID=221103 RepID=V2YKV1_MONRO|nr:hypothetical protein Moror_4604 [Moniliophthora roreri MCA 2997]